MCLWPLCLIGIDAAARRCKRVSNQTITQATMIHKIKTIIWMIGAFFKEIYELITGKRKWS